jgi:hypothetical protein
MDVIIKKRRGGPPLPPQRQSRSSPRGRRYGAWGRVKTLHSEDNTVDVVFDNGIYLKRVPVFSKEWVVSGEDSEKDYNSGERDLPPEHARVFVMMPIGTPEGCFVLCSGFSAIDKTKPYMGDDREKIKERITPSGWHVTDDYMTGRHKAVSPDGETSLEIDYGEKELKKVPELHLKLFENIRADVISDENIIVTVFDFKEAKERIARITINDDLIETKYREKSTVLMDEDHIRTYTEKNSVDMTKGNIQATNGKDIIKMMDGDIDVESPTPIGIDGTNTKLGAGVLQPYWASETAAWNQWPVFIPPVPWPPGMPVPPAPPIINMALNALKAALIQADATAQASGARSIK